MQIHTNGIRTPERWLKCDACGTIEDISIEQYFHPGDPTTPQWFNQGTFRPLKPLRGSE
jgi:hypothetical protein